MAKVKLGKNAQVFHDQLTGISVFKGQVVELNVRQLNSPKVKRALSGGHLVYATDADLKSSKKRKEDNPEDELEVPKLLKEFQKKVEKGMTNEKLAKAFSFDKLKKMCEASNIEVEEGDTSEDLIEALKGTSEEDTTEEE